MSFPASIPLTKTGKGPEGPGCWSCKHSQICSFRRGLDKLLFDHLDFVEVDRNPTHSLLPAVLGEVCKQWEDGHPERVP